MCRIISEAVEEGQLIRSKKYGSQPAVKEETAEPVEQEEAQKKATADFQEREKKVAEEIATKPETEIGTAIQNRREYKCQNLQQKTYKSSVKPLEQE